MLNEAETAELRALQGRAYGRDAAPLTDDEGERLAVLQARETPDRGAVAERPLPADARDGSEGQVPASSLTPEPHQLELAAEVDEAVEPDAEQSAPSRPARARRVLTISLAALVAVSAGVGVGWLLFGDRVTDAIALTPEEQQAREQLYETFDDYDDGSIRAAGRSEDVMAWTATRGDGEDYCLIIQQGDRESGDCLPADELRVSQTLYTQLSGFAAEDGEQWDSIAASMTIALDGEPSVTLQRWTNTSSDALQQLPERYRDIGQQLIDAGYEGWLQVVAFDGDATIWRANRVADDMSEDCIIYAPERGVREAPAVCAPTVELSNGEDATEEQHELTMSIDQADGTVRAITLVQTSWNSYVVITEVPREEIGDVPEASFDDLVDQGTNVEGAAPDSP